MFDHIARTLKAKSSSLNRARARAFAASGFSAPVAEDTERPREEWGDLRLFFENRQEGRGIWKWLHYFDIYERHLSRFRNATPNVLEIGIYSGGSLDMWRQYFGAGCRLIGVDIEESVRAYQDEDVTIHVGDQSDPQFWRGIIPSLPPLDIVLDDGGHAPHQQIETLEALLPVMRPGGVYLCEDVLGDRNPFSDYIAGLMAALDGTHWVHRPGESIASATSGFQAAIGSIHRYPYVVVIEKLARPVERFSGPKRGTEWQPFLTSEHKELRMLQQYGLLYRLKKLWR